MHVPGQSSGSVPLSMERHCMKDQDTVTQFIALRAQGWTFDRIADRRGDGLAGVSEEILQSGKEIVKF